MIWKMRLCADGTPNFTGPSGNFCFDAPANQSDITSQLENLIPMNIAIPNYVEDHRLMEELISLFLKEVNPYYRFVDPSLRPSVAEPRSDLHLLQLAMCAAGSLYPQHTDCAVAGRTFAEYAESLALSCCRTHPSLYIVQALSILCWYELSQDSANTAWVYNSTAAAIAIQLGLHVIGFEGSSDGQSTIEIENAEKIRTFWCFAFMDRIATSELGRQCVMPWRRIRTPSMLQTLEPCSTRDDIAFAHQCELWFLHDRYMDQM
jgi:hypothetical protein